MPLRALFVRAAVLLVGTAVGGGCSPSFQESNGRADASLSPDTPDVSRDAAGPIQAADAAAFVDAGAEEASLDAGPVDGGDAPGAGADATDSSAGVDAATDDAPLDAGFAADATVDADATLDAAIPPLVCDGGVPCPMPDGGLQCSDTTRDPANCGGCGLVCPSGCAAGECLVTVWSGGHPASLAMDGENLYFGDPDAGTVTRAPLDGGAAITLATGQSEWQAPGTNAGEIVAAGGSVYWADSTYVATVGPDGGVLPVTPPSPSLRGFAVDVGGGAVYWQSSGGLARTSLASGATTTLTALCGNAPPVFDGTTVTVFPGLPGCGDFAIAVSPGGGVTTLVPSIPGNVYFAALGGGIIAYSVQTLGSCVCDPSCPLPLTSDAEWADGLGALSAGEGPALSKLAPYPFGAGVSVLSVATDGAGVFVGTLGAVSRVALGGGAPSLLAAAATPVAVVVGGASLYWADASVGVVMRLTPR